MQIVISITSVVVECVVVSSYRSRIAIVITVLKGLSSHTVHLGLCKNLVLQCNSGSGRGSDADDDSNE